MLRVIVLLEPRKLKVYSPQWNGDGPESVRINGITGPGRVLQILFATILLLISILVFLWIVEMGMNHQPRAQWKNISCN